jgi:hypothetical protein
MSHPYAATLPARPSLEQQKIRAKELLKAVRAGEPAALTRLRWSHPRLAQYDLAALPGLAKLADAQWVVARELGFASWPALKAHIDSLRGRAPVQRPFETDPQYYRDRAWGLASVRETGERGALRIIQRFHPAFRDMAEAQVHAAAFTQADAELVVAREHGFEDFGGLERRLAAIRDGQAVEPFQQAFEAIKADDAAGFAALLDAHPDLVNAQGTNGNSLMSLALYFRRDAMMEALLARGVDLTLANDKGSTALHNIAAGGGGDEGALARLDRLIAAGAPVEAEAYGDGGTALAMALFWGKRRVAERLAAEGVTPLNLRVAAGLGRVPLMQALTGPDGRLLPEAGRGREFHRPHSGFPPWRPSDDAQEILDEALTYAARNGRVEAMAWLVAQGADVNAEPYNGTPLIWATRQDRLEAIDWLLAHGAEVDRPGGMGGITAFTPLQAAASWEGRPEAARRLLQAGARVDLADAEYNSPPAGWARFHDNPEVAAVIAEFGG